MQRTIHSKITLNASPEKVYEMWTTEQGLTSFFAPKCKIEIKPFGTYEMLFLATGTGKFEERVEYLVTAGTFVPATRKSVVRTSVLTKKVL